MIVQTCPNSVDSVVVSVNTTSGTVQPVLSPAQCLAPLFLLYDTSNDSLLVNCGDDTAVLKYNIPTRSIQMIASDIQCGTTNYLAVDTNTQIIYAVCESNAIAISTGYQCPIGEVISSCIVSQFHPVECLSVASL